MKFPTALAPLLAAMLLCTTITPTATPADTLPSQISDAEFWRFVTEFSEPNGPYPYENYVGNEVMLQRVIPAAKKETKPGGVYIGVGPEQNFTYALALEAKMAFVVDIRRQNMLEHLWYKALFSLAANRAEYLALLVSRQPPQIKPNARLDDILDAVRTSPTSEKLFLNNLASVKKILTETYKLRLSPDDLTKIEYVYRTFWEENLELRFSSIGRGNALMYPTFEEMLRETDRQGREQNYLSTEELFQWLKKFEGENRLIPIVGDFAGPHALQTVGAFMKANGMHVSTFYTSNVEFYLFGRPTWTRYVANVRSLPVADDSIFIRSYFPNGPVHPLNMPGHRSTSLVSSMSRFLRDSDSHRLESYWDIVKP